MRPVAITLALALMVSLAGCRRTPEVDTPNVLVLGTRAMTPLIQDVAARFNESNPGIRIDVEPAQADRTVADTRAGLADIGLLGRALKADELGVRGHAIGRDGIVFVVNAGNQVPVPLEPHLVGILTRVYTNWRDVGGSDRPITVVGGGDGHTIRAFLVDYFGLRQPQLRPDPSIGSNRKILETVASQPYAIGYVSLGAYETFENKQAIRVFPFHGVAPTIENVRNRSYPLIRNLTLLTREPTHDNAKTFVEFALSEQCYDLIAKYGFVPAGPGS